MKIIKCILIGFGYIGKKYLHEISQNPNTELLGIYDLNPLVYKDLPEFFSANTFNNLDDFLNHHNIADVCIIATPNGTHEEITIKALQYGFNVLIEKPIALKHTHYDSIIDTGNKIGKRLFPVLQNRYSPVNQYVKKIISDNTLGKIYQVQINCYWNRDERYYLPKTWRGNLDLDGGTLFTQFSHFLDILCWFFGKPSVKYADFFNHNHQDLIDFEDTGNVVLYWMDKNISGTLSYSTCAYDKNMESAMTIIAEKGTIKISGQYMENISFFHVKDTDMPMLPPIPPPNQYQGYTGSANQHNKIIEEVVLALNNLPNQLPHINEALESIKLIEEIYSHRVL